MMRSLLIGAAVGASILALWAMSPSPVSDSPGVADQSPRSVIRTPNYRNADTCLTLNEWVDPFQEIRSIVGAFAPSVSVADEMEVGDALFEELQNEEAITSAPERARVVFRRLVTKLEQKESVAGFNYRLHYMPNNEEVNAFTFGGHVYLTQGMMDYIETDDELACVLGHELYHNELGHINTQISEFQAAMTLGMLSGFDEGLVAGFVNGMMGLESALTPPFNQENELMCDLHGVDLAEYAGYDGCAARNFWLRMDQTNEFDFERLLSTHPGGDDRADCIHHHIGHFYNLPCN